MLHACHKDDACSHSIYTDDLNEECSNNAASIKSATDRSIIKQSVARPFVVAVCRITRISQRSTCSDGRDSDKLTIDGTMLLR